MKTSRIEEMVDEFESRPADVIALGEPLNQKIYIEVSDHNNQLKEAYRVGKNELEEDIRLLTEEIERLREDVEIARKAGRGE